MALNPSIFAIPSSLDIDPDPSFQIERYLTSLHPFHSNFANLHPGKSEPFQVQKYEPTIIWEDEDGKSGLGSRVGEKMVKQESSIGTERVLTRREMLEKYPERDQSEREGLDKEKLNEPPSQENKIKRCEEESRRENSRHRSKFHREYHHYHHCDEKRHFRPEHHPEQKVEYHSESLLDCDQTHRHEKTAKTRTFILSKSKPEPQSRSPSVISTESAQRRRDRKLKRRLNKAITRSPPRRSPAAKSKQEEEEVKHKKRTKTTTGSRLMDNFNSNAIVSERLTVKPRKIGMLGKAVASRPVNLANPDRSLKGFDHRAFLRLDEHPPPQPFLSREQASLSPPPQPTRRHSRFFERSQPPSPPTKLRSGAITLHEIAARSIRHSTSTSTRQSSSRRKLEDQMAGSELVSPHGPGRRRRQQRLPLPGLTSSPPWSNQPFTTPSQTVRELVSVEPDLQLRDNPYYATLPSDLHTLPRSTRHVSKNFAPYNSDTIHLITPQHSYDHVDNTWKTALQKPQGQTLCRDRFERFNGRVSPFLPPLDPSNAVTPGPWADSSKNIPSLDPHSPLGFYSHPNHHPDKNVTEHTKIHGVENSPRNHSHLSQMAPRQAPAARSNEYHFFGPSYMNPTPQFQSTFSPSFDPLPFWSHIPRKPTPYPPNLSLSTPTPHHRSPNFTSYNYPLIPHLTSSQAQPFVQPQHPPLCHQSNLEPHIKQIEYDNMTSPYLRSELNLKPISTNHLAELEPAPVLAAIQPSISSPATPINNSFEVDSFNYWHLPETNEHNPQIESFSNKDVNTQQPETYARSLIKDKVIEKYGASEEDWARLWKR